MVKLIQPINGETVNLQTELQRSYSKAVREKEDLSRFEEIISNTADPRTAPLPVHFVWESDDLTNEFVLSDDASFSNVLFRTSDCTCCDVAHLQIGTTYYWKVGDSETASFVTSDALPRWINAEGTYNVRDIGGYRTMDGKRVKQGVLIRGTQIDYLTPKGVRDMREVFNIRFDLDMRNERIDDATLLRGVTTSPLGGDIGYTRIEADAYETFVSEEEKYKCRQIFDLLTDPSNYPLYYHCELGADRTGTLSMVIEGMLGLSDADIAFDFLQTSLGGNIRERAQLDFWKDIFPEETTIAGKAVRFLHSCGVTDEEMDMIRSIMLED